MLLNLKKLALVCTLLMEALAAQATTIDFVSLANHPPGELGAPMMNFNVGGAVLTITAGYNTSTANDYLDSGHGGLGVCKVLDVNRQCAPSDDDNVTVGEYLLFSFDRNVTISNMWFNNLHDGDMSLLNNHVLIGGNLTGFGSTASSAGDWLANVGPFVLNANTTLRVAYSDEEFYVSKMDVAAVPVPGTLALLGLGLISLALTRRKQAV
ncbi:MAG: PEP-CTERM sorting domain-containing protein [Burkholderiaceae bacterium]